MLVFRYRQKQKFYEAVMSTIDASAPTMQKYYEEMYNGYRQAMFPYVEKTANVDKQRALQALEAAFAAGPIRIQGGAIIPK